jgi:hypothetical protein
MRRSSLAAIALLLVIWHAQSHADAVAGPGPRNKPGFVYDIARRTFVLFGGFGGRGPEVRGDTWHWNGTRWTEAVLPGPSARGAMGMAYDAGRRKVVLFGGATLTGQLGDTWESDGTGWTQVSTSGPSPRGGLLLVYDSHQQRIVGFGGFDQAGGKMLGETWAWDGATWRLLNASGPAQRSSHGLAYDSRRNRVVLFGGNPHVTPPPGGGFLNDTWEFDGTHWTRVAEAGPSGRDHHAMTYDSRRGKVVVFGGWDGVFLGDTWEWDGVTWTQAATTGPSARGGVPSLAFDSVGGKAVLFGGWGAAGALDDVWEWNGKQWTRGPLSTPGSSARVLPAADAAGSLSHPPDQRSVGPRLSAGTAPIQRRR